VTAQTARLFIAVPVADEVRRAAAGLIQELRASGADYKWVEPDNLHLTLRFLGATPLEGLPRIEELMRRAAQRPSFEVCFGGFGAFSSWQEPRVVWVGVGRGAAELAAIAADLGPTDDEKPHSAHLTIGRMRSRRNLERLVKAAAAARFQELHQKIGEIVLYESFLTPQGPVYAVRIRQKLGVV